MLSEYALTFTLLSLFTLGRHFWSDIKELQIDSRRNHLMIGSVLTIGLLSNQATVLLIAGILTIIITILLSWFEKRQGNVIFGDGDKEILTWSIPGLSLVFGYSYAAFFLGLLMVSFFILAGLRQSNLLNKTKLPGLIFITISYLIVFIFGWFL